MGIVTYEKVDESCVDSMKLLRIISLTVGIFPFGIRYKSKHTNNINNIIVLVMFLLIFFITVLWYEIFEASHNGTLEIIRAIDLFTESISSVLDLAVIATKTKLYETFWNLMVEADFMCLSLGLDTGYSETKRVSIITFIYFSSINVLVFVTDYFLLIRTSTNHTFVLSSFVSLVIYTLHNSCSSYIACFFVYTLRKRFRLLNSAMRNLPYGDIAIHSKRLPLNITGSHISALTVRRQVENIKSAHDNYVAVCQCVNGLLQLRLWIQIASNLGVITTNLYAGISMVIDREYDFCIFLHCIIWVIYRIYNLLAVIYVFTVTANEVSFSFILNNMLVLLKTLN